MTHWRTLSSAVFLGALNFCPINAQAAGNPWVYETCANWIQYHSHEAFPDQMPRIGTCSPERLRAACRLAVTRAPIKGLKLCPDELCPTIGRALIALGMATLHPGELPTVYRLCPQQR